MLNQRVINTEFCVIGGGLAGVSAAISAARCGIKTVLIQERPVLGGNASSEIRMWICGAQGRHNRESGLIEEIALENLYRNPTKNHFIADSILLDFVQREKNITLLMNATCMDAETENGSFSHGRTTKIKSVKAYQLTTQTNITVNADFFADCSGDSILAPLTGAKFRMGREANSEFDEDTKRDQPDDMVMGMSCMIQGRETTRKVDFTPSERITRLTDENVKNRPMNIYDDYENFWYLELGGNRNTITETEDVKNELIPLALGTWDHIKNSGKYNAENWELEFLGFLPGKRESRRMEGEYIVNQKDISSGRIFEDTVAFGGWPLDDHFPAGYYHKGAPNTAFVTPAPYTLPYRALYSKNVENLFFAGRNISMTHTAMSSVRVMATCSLLGCAVGTAAAIAVKNGLTPHDVYLQKLGELQQTLMNADAFLPHFTRKISPLCKTSLKNGGEALFDGKDRANGIYNTENEGVTVKNGEKVTYEFGDEKFVNSVHIVFDSDLNRDTVPGSECEKYHQTRANVKLDSPMMHLPTTLAKSFVLEVVTKNGAKTVLKNENNFKRCYHVGLNEKVLAINLVVNSNWGDGNETNIISFDFN